MKKKMKGFSVCLYESTEVSKEAVEKCLESIFTQSWAKKNDEYEIIVGCNDCPVGLDDGMKSISCFYPEDKDAEKYVVLNSLAKIAKYDTLVFVDAGSILHQDYLDKIASNIDGYDAVSCKYNDKRKDYIAAISKKTFEEFGGFRKINSWGEKEFAYRTKLFVKIHNIDESLYDTEYLCSDAQIVVNSAKIKENAVISYTECKLKEYVFKLKETVDTKDISLVDVLEKDDVLSEKNDSDDKVISDVTEICSSEKNDENVYSAPEDDMDAVERKLEELSRRLIDNNVNEIKSTVTKNYWDVEDGGIVVCKPEEPFTFI